MSEFVQQWSHTARVGANVSRGRPSAVVGLAGAAILVSVFGCGKPATFVTGVVTLDGKPLEGAILQFRPVAGDGWTTSVLSESSGRYRAKIAPVPMLVAIAKDEGTVPNVVQILPPRYSDSSKSELRVTPVEGKTTQADFALSSSKN